MMLAAVQITLLALVATYFLSIVLAHALTWLYFGRYDRVYPATRNQPAVSIIKPTKGADQLAPVNFRSCCEQDYSGEFEILFCVEGRLDAAIPVIEQIAKAYPDRRVRLIFSDPQDTRSVGKLKNSIAGLAASTYDIVIFSDDDTYVPRTFLRESVAAIDHAGIGLSFSAPAYQGAKNAAAALMNVSVNELVLRLAAVCLLKRFDGAVGTIMVTRRAVLEHIGGLEQFGRQAVDDIPLARAILAHGYQVHLLKQPARVLHPHDSFRRWWSHMHRWRVIIRRHWPIKSTIMNAVDLALWWSLLYFAIALFERQPAGLGAALIAAVLVVSLISTAVVNLKFVRDTTLWRFLWVVPILELSRLPLFIHSWLTDEIAWRGMRFRINPDGTMEKVGGASAAYELSEGKQ